MHQKTTPSMKRLARIVAKRRSELGASQEDFAALIGISRGFLSDVERGVRSVSVETLRAICRHAKLTDSQVLSILR